MTELVDMVFKNKNQGIDIDLQRIQLIIINNDINDCTFTIHYKPNSFFIEKEIINTYKSQMKN